MDIRKKGKIEILDKDATLSRFLKFVMPEPNTGCWFWTGVIRGSAMGYGGFRVGKHMVQAHRFSYYIHKGEIGDNYVLHSCDNPHCVNPDHLFLGTHQDNMNDMNKKDRGVTFKGEAHNKAKLSELEVIDIISSHKKGVSNRTLSEIYNISFSNVCRITSGKLWKHIALKCNR